MQRRWVLAAALAAAACPGTAWAAAPAGGAGEHVLTLWRDGDVGQRLEVRGRVMDARLQPLAGATVRVRQADGSGEYTDAYRGTLTTDARGEYVLRTALPGNYGRPLHIHLHVSHPGAGDAYTEVLFKGDPLLADADVPQAIALETVRVGGREYKVGTFDIVLGRD